MTAALITPPAIEPVTVAEAKAHLRVEHDLDDDLLGALMTAARCHVEAQIRQVLVTQTWRVYRDAWPATGIVELPVAPVQSVAAVTVYDTEGVPAVLGAEAYRVDVAARPARIAFVAARPSPGPPLNGIEIDVVAGYGATGLAVPAPLRQAIMMLAARWYEDREGAALGSLPGRVADEVTALLAPFRSPRLL